jgi:hypothetical protein
VNVLGITNHLFLNFSCKGWNTSFTSSTDLRNVRCGVVNSRETNDVLSIQERPSHYLTGKLGFMQKGSV